MEVDLQATVFFGICDKINKAEYQSCLRKIIIKESFQVHRCENNDIAKMTQSRTSSPTYSDQDCTSHCHFFIVKYGLNFIRKKGQMVL